MRKSCKVTILTLIVAVTVLLLTACHPQANVQVNVTFMVDGEVFATRQISESDFALPENPKKESFRFTGWYLDAEFKTEFKAFQDLPKGKSDVMVYAAFVPKFYQFRFFTSDTSFINRMVTDVANLSFPEDPINVGYDFKGWFLNNTTLIDEDNVAILCSSPATYNIYAKYECAHKSFSEETLINSDCERDGERFVTCKVCGKKIVFEVLPSTGHTVVIDGAVEPTCLTDGKTQGSHCSACNKVFVGQTNLNALGHRYDGGTVTVPSTCTSVGKRLFTCTREYCTHSYTEEIPPHTPGGWRVLVIADCVNAGVRVKECEVCRAELEREEIAATGHDLSAVGFDESSHTQRCLICGENFSSPHAMNGTDACDYCPFYIPDTPVSGSAIKNVAKRDPISKDFENQAGVYGGTLEVVVIDIAQGDSLFIRFPDGQTMLMDSGSVNFPIGNHYDRVKKVLNRYGVKSLDYLFITHSDYDHVRYIDDVLNDYEIKNIYIPKIADDSNGSTWEKVTAAIANEQYTAADGGVRYAAIRYNVGDFEISGEGWRMKCHSYLSSDYPLVTGSTEYSHTAPDADRDEIINSLSPICLLEYAGRTIVLTGDSNEYNEKYLIDRGVFDGVDADVLKVGHHGSKTSTTSEFLSAVNCEYAIISYGTNVFGHPTSEVLNRLEMSGCKRIFKTKEDGDITVSVSGNGRLIISTAKSADKDISENLPLATLKFRAETAKIFKRKENDIAA